MHFQRFNLSPEFADTENPIIVLFFCFFFPLKKVLEAVNPQTSITSTPKKFWISQTPDEDPLKDRKGPDLLLKDLFHLWCSCIWTPFVHLVCTSCSLALSSAEEKCYILSRRASGHCAVH